MLKYYIIFFTVTYNYTIENKKDWTILIYMAGANDLQPYIQFNIKQMAAIGSNERINIIARTFTKKKKAFSETVFIKKNKIHVLETHTNTNAGDPENLIAFCIDTIQKYPASHYALILWDHGTGAIDPVLHNRITTASLFSLQEHQTSKYTPPFLSLINLTRKNLYKGVCFDEQTKYFLSEEKLNHAFSCIKQKISCEKKVFDIIAFDACLMAMIEIAKIVAPFTDYMVASQEIEAGTGWNYTHAFSPFLKASLSPKVFGIHLVNAYEKTYKATKDYTLSLLETEHIKKIENNINGVAQILTQTIKQKGSDDLLYMIRKSRSKLECTCFDEPAYIDIQHFYKNLLIKIQKAQQESGKSNNILINIESKITEGIALLKKAVITKKNGPLYANAQGLSIYFPEYIIHSAYKKTLFAKDNNDWISLLSSVLTWYY